MTYPQTAQPLVSVLMPAYKQAGFFLRALDSLLAQRWTGWELWILDDGSPDSTGELAAPYLRDPRIHYRRTEHNLGLGATLNRGLELAQGEAIAYLPADDVYYPEHLLTLLTCLQSDPGIRLSYSGARHHYNRSAPGIIDGFPLQLVQVMHRKTPQRWMERSELVTDDLERMFWVKLRAEGRFEGTGLETCEWVSHPHQRHKILQEPVGGINPYRLYYQVREPLRFHTTVGNRIDEVAQYAHYRDRPAPQPSPDGLKILLVGELAYNADRILALEERGHTLYGLWMPDPYWYNTVGPLPFGHVTDIPCAGWRDAVCRIQPDVIYALLNWQAVPFVHTILRENPGIPLVWHFKEGPFISLEKGHWTELMDLYAGSDGLIYTSPEMRQWFETLLPGQLDPERSLVLDGDLPKQDWFHARFSPRLSERDGEIHTVVPGRPIGLHPADVSGLAQQGIHLHFYGDFTHGQWLGWIEKTRQLAPRHIHLHQQVDQDGWVREFSQYDAGWLHFFESKNQGEIRRANWDDLNLPARLATLAAAGLPLLQRDNPGAIVAAQNLARKLDIGLFFTDMAGLRDQLLDEKRVAQLRANMARQRAQFTFDHHADDLVSFFRKIIAGRRTSWRG